MTEDQAALKGRPGPETIEATAGRRGAVDQAASGSDDVIHMIVARSRNEVIGSEGDIPWRLRGDMRFFRETTTGNTVVMGRKTFESIGKPLPNRKNIVITRDRNFRPSDGAEGVTVVHSPEEALSVPRIGKLFIIGGQQIYEAFLPDADVIYMTVVEADIEGDARFPELGPEWELMELSRHEADDGNEYAFTIYRAERRGDAEP